MSNGWNTFVTDFRFVFIQDDRWKSLFQGLGNTLVITFFAVMIGIVLGAIVATVRTTYDKNNGDMKKRNPVGFYILSIANVICKLYLTVIRGTPVVVQLMIASVVIVATSNLSRAVAVFGFGITSGGSVAEIIRGGIMSIDEGQFEAGRSLGFNYGQTMIYIIIPQVFKVVLPTLCNEFIVLLKETSVAGYVGIMDLTKAGDIIRGRTFSAFLPLLGVAAIYLVMVVILTALVGCLERSLRKNER